MIFIGPTSGASSIDIHDNGLSNNDVDSSTKTTYLDTGILSTDEVTNLEEGIRGIEHKYKRTHSCRQQKNHRNLRNHRTTSAHTNNVGDILYNHEAIVGRALTECTDHVTYVPVVTKLVRTTKSLARKLVKVKMGSNCVVMERILTLMDIHTKRVMVSPAESAKMVVVRDIIPATTPTLIQ